MRIAIVTWAFLLFGLVIRAQLYDAPVWINYDQNTLSQNYLITLKDGKRGISDITGKVIFHPNFKTIRAIAKDKFVFRLQTDRRVGLIDIDSNVIFPEQFTVLYTENRVNLLARTEHTSGIVSFGGDTLMDFIKGGSKDRRSTLVMYARNIIKRENGAYVFYTPNLERAFDETYKNFQWLNYAKAVPHNLDIACRPARYAVKKKGNWYLINEKGEYLNNDNYDDIWYEISNVIILKKDGRFGAVDTTGAPIVDFEYRELSPASYHQELGVTSFEVRKWRKMGLVGPNGEEWQPFIYKRIYTADSSTGVHYGIIRNNKIRLIDRNGTALNETPLYSAYLMPYANAYKVSIKRNGKMKRGVMDQHGVINVPLEYDSITYRDNQYEAALNGIIHHYTYNGYCLDCQE